jgi:hypothetical protein
VSATNNDPNPLSPNSGSSDNPPDPDAGKDLSYLVPNVQDVWHTPPSFNLDPPGSQSSSSNSGSAQVADSGPINVDLASVRTGEQFLLAAVDEGISGYNSLRGQVSAATSNPDFWSGPDPMATTPNNDYHVLESAAPSVTGMDPSKGADAKDQDQIYQMGQQFAAIVNPAQEKALWQIANALELVGSYLGAVNQSGQTYAQVDRAARFPEPPAGS